MYRVAYADAARTGVVSDHPQAAAVSETATQSPPSGATELERVAPLLDELPGAVLILDGAGTIRYMNRIAEHRIDQARGDVLGRDLFREVLPHLEADGFGDRYRSALRSPAAALAWETEIASVEGSRRVGFGVRSLETGGSRWGIVLIEDRSALAGEIDRRKRAERLAAVGELAAGAAHEINNPLASIKGFAQLLARETLDRGQQQALEIISQECTRVARIVDNLLDFASQQRVSEREAVDLSGVAASVLTLKRYSLETSGIAIDADLDGALSPVSAEKGAMQRLLLILINQAERSLNRREGDRQLTVRTRESNDGVVLYVSDNGPGIPRHQLPYLLEQYEEDAGGLGLNSADLITREHGGTLWVESGEGRGTTVTVRVPRAMRRNGSAEVAAPPARVEEPDEERPVRVLVADDEPTLRLALSMFLGRHGYEVEQAEDADQAFQLATRKRFDVALVDVRMPGDGLSLLDRLGEAPEWTGSAILMTGDQTLPRVRDEIRAGRPHLTKPFDMMEAVRLIEKLSSHPSESAATQVRTWTSS